MKILLPVPIIILPALSSVTLFEVLVSVVRPTVHPPIAPLVAVIIPVIDNEVPSKVKLPDAPAILTLPDASR